MINGIHHVSINVKDVQESIKFYVDLLGMEQISRPDLGFHGAWLKSSEHEVHLLGIDSTPPPKEQHFAFAVDETPPGGWRSPLCGSLVGICDGS